MQPFRPLFLALLAHTLGVAHMMALEEWDDFAALVLVATESLLHSVYEAPLARLV